MVLACGKDSNAASLEFGMRSAVLPSGFSRLGSCSVFGVGSLAALNNLNLNTNGEQSTEKRERRSVALMCPQKV